MVYHLVAAQIDEVKIIGRKLENSKISRNYDEPTAKTSFWDTIAKHPLSQTCQVLRKEFDPIHQHHALETKVPLYVLNVENFNWLTEINLATILPRMPSLLAHLQVTRVGRHGVNRLRVRYLLNKYASQSVEELDQQQHRIGESYLQLVQIVQPSYAPSKVVLTVRNDVGLTLAQQNAVITYQEAKAVRDSLQKLEARLNQKYALPFNNLHGFSIRVVRMFSSHLKDAQVEHDQELKRLREAREKAKMKHNLRREIKADLREELKDELRRELRGEIKAEVENNLRARLEAEARTKIRKSREEEAMQEDVAQWERRERERDQEEARLGALEEEAREQEALRWEAWEEVYR